MTTNYAEINQQNKIAERIAYYVSAGFTPERMVGHLMTEFALVPTAAVNAIARHGYKGGNAQR